MGRHRNTQAERFAADRPIPPDGSDQLGFRAIAASLAKSLLAHSADDGFVVGVEGAWGSGKSSLLNLLVHELQRKRKTSPEVVRFAPWLVGNRDALVVALLNDLAAAVERIQEPNESPIDKAKDKSVALASKLRVYASKVGKIGAPLANLASALGVPLASIVGSALSSVAEVVDASASEATLEQSKTELIKGLSTLPRRIVVIIDDVDRLEPTEIVEVTRLVRAVADFPNVTYVVCYDRGVLSKGLENVLSLEDGSIYLDKIFQVSFPIPRPEAFDLRRWLLKEASALFVATTERQLDEETASDLRSVCDSEGQFIDTPRDVVRILNALRLYWPPVMEHAYFPDVVWIQLIRIKNLSLYKWIERYMTEIGAIVEGRSIILKSDRRKMSEELNSYLAADDEVSGPRSRWTLSEYLPGMKDIPGFDDKSENLLYKISDRDLKKFEPKKRIGSPQHYRFYFAFSRPSGALDDEQLHGFVQLSASAIQDASALFLRLANTIRPQGGTMADVLIDRLRRTTPDNLTEGEREGILRVFSKTMDAAALAQGRSDWGGFSLWDNSTPALKSLMASIPRANRESIVRALFGDGDAIGWLMNVIRGETFAHGRVGQRQEDESQWVFTDDEFDLAVSILLERLRGTARDKIAGTPALLSFLFGWLQAGDEDGVRAWVREQVITDEGMLQFLSKTRGWAASNKVYFPLKRADLNHFIDFKKLEKRIQDIAESDEVSDQRALAKELLLAIKEADGLER